MIWQPMTAGAGLVVGVPLDEIDLRVISAALGARPWVRCMLRIFRQSACRREKAGEIVVSGGHLLKGYLHGVGDEETKFRVNGTTWHRTGDSGYFDDRGRLWLPGA